MTDYTTTEADLSYSVRSQWGSGFVADFELTALEAINGWRISFELDAEIVNLWNARIVSHVGNRYVIEALSYNDTLAAGAVAGFGFQASDGATAIDPDSVTINDVPVGDTPEPEPVVPDITVSDITVTEGGDGQAVFLIELSEATTVDVTIDYLTRDRSGLAGEDYIAKSGTLVIAAGQTSAQIAVGLVDDNEVEGLERFILRLTSAENATLADDRASAFIEDDDTAPPPPPVLPQVSIGDVEVAEGDPGEGGSGGGTGLFADGPLSTSGNQIVDSDGEVVEIRAVNWFGLETELYAPHGLWARNWQDMMDQMKELGFNAIRLPFSGELATTGGPAPSGIDFNLNPDLIGLSGIDIMDEIVAYAGEIGLRVLLDHHRTDAGSGANGSGLWYDGSTSEADWIAMWQSLAERYEGDDTIIGADLHNEPHGSATWGTGGATDWARAAEAAGNAIHQVNSDWLIVVEGIGGQNGFNYWWGGDLTSVRNNPVELDQAGKLVYSPHDYPASVYDQPWFNDGSNLYDVFNNAWGYIYEEGIAPVLLGEFGSRLETAKDLAWAEAITNYLGGDFDGDGTNDLGAGEGRISYAWWSWNPNSGDTGGILNDDWTTVRQGAIDLLDPLLEEPADVPPGGDPDPVYVEFTVSLDEPAATAFTLDFATEDGTATAGEDYVATSGTLSFAAGEQQKTVSVEVLPDTVEEDDETFFLRLTGDAEGDLLAEATLTDDDANVTPPPPPPPPPGDDEGFEAFFFVRNDWGAGATVDITITNTGAEAVNGWELAFDLPVGIDQIWSGVLEDAGSGRYEVGNVGYNGSIAPGASVSFGFNTTIGGLDADTLNANADFEFFA